MGTMIIGWIGRPPGGTRWGRWLLLPNCTGNLTWNGKGPKVGKVCVNPALHLRVCKGVCVQAGGGRQAGPPAGRGGNWEVPKGRGEGGKSRCPGSRHLWGRPRQVRQVGWWVGVRQVSVF